jgi:hypothetical protein
LTLAISDWANEHEHTKRNYALKGLLLSSSLGGSLLSSLGGLANLVDLGDGLDDTDGNGLTHVTDGETTEGWVLGECLNAHGLGGNELNDGGISRLDGLGVGLSGFAGTTVDLLDDLVELAGNVSGVAIEHWLVSVVDLTGVVQNDDLSLEALASLGWVVLGVSSNHSTTDFLDGQTLDVEANVVSGNSLSEGLVMHLNGLDLSGEHSGGENNDHVGLENSGLDTADGHCSDTTNLVHILKGKTQGLLRGAGGWDHGIEGLNEGGSRGITSLLAVGDGPVLEPGHLRRNHINGRN